MERYERVKKRSIQREALLEATDDSLLDDETSDEESDEETDHTKALKEEIDDKSRCFTKGKTNN